MRAGAASVWSQARTMKFAVEPATHLNPTLAAGTSSGAGVLLKTAVPHPHNPPAQDAPVNRRLAVPLVQVKLIEGVFSHLQKRQMIEKLTEAMVSIEGERM